MVSNSINWRFIPDLTGSPDDLSSQQYQRLKEHLTLVRASKSVYRFIYLMGRKTDGTIFFFVDSESPDSVNNYSPPARFTRKHPLES